MATAFAASSLFYVVFAQILTLMRMLLVQLWYNTPFKLPKDKNTLKKIQSFAVQGPTAKIYLHKWE